MEYEGIIFFTLYLDNYCIGVVTSKASIIYKLSNDSQPRPLSPTVGLTLPRRDNTQVAVIGFYLSTHHTSQRKKP